MSFMKPFMMTSPSPRCLRPRHPFQSAVTKAASFETKQAMCPRLACWESSDPASAPKVSSMNGKPTSMATHRHCRRATILSDFYPVEKRGQILAWFYMAIPVGSALGYVLGGAVAASSIGDLGAHLLGIHAESWRWAFILVPPVGDAVDAVDVLRGIRTDREIVAPLPEDQNYTARLRLGHVPVRPKRGHRPPSAMQKEVPRGPDTPPSRIRTAGRLSGTDNPGRPCFESYPTSRAARTCDGPASERPSEGRSRGSRFAGRCNPYRTGDGDDDGKCSRPSFPPVPYGCSTGTARALCSLEKGGKGLWKHSS